MKETLSRFLFSVRYAYKNIVKNILRSLLLTLSLIALATSLLLASSSRSFMTEYFLGDLQSKYGDIDAIASVGTTGNARYFTIRTLNDHPDQSLYFKEVIPFFEIDTLVDVGSEKIYVKVMSSSIDELKKVSSVSLSRGELTENQVILTQSFADSHQLMIGNTLSMQLAQSTKSYTIVDIVEDGGLMTGNVIYLNKTYSLPFFLSALNPALSSLPEIFVANLYNTLYLDIREDQSIESITDYLHGLSGYSNLTINETINLNEINEMIDRNMAVFSVIFVIVIFAILLVMSTTMLVYFEDKKQMIAIVDLLGGRSQFSYGVILLEFALFFVLSSLFSIWIAQLIVTFGMSFVGSKSTYLLESRTIFLTLGVTLLLFLLSSLRYYLHAKRSASIREVNEHLQKDPLSCLVYLVISILSIILFVVFTLVDVGFYSLWIRLSSIVVLLFAFPFLIIRFLADNQAKTTLNFHMKMLFNQPSFRHYASVLLLSFLSIFLLVLTNTHMDQRFTSHRAEYQVDYILTNFITRYDITTQEIKAMPEVQNADQVLIYENIVFPEYDDSMLMTVSIDPSKIDVYFNLAIDDDSQDALLESFPVILLPERYQMLYELEKGDIIIANIHPDFPNLSMVIGGFFEKYIANVAFTNLHHIEAYEGTGIASIVVNGTDDSEQLYQTLITNYSQRLVYVLDYQELVESNVMRMERATSYLTIILSAIVLCFVLSIINHSLLLLIQMRKNDARLSILGISRVKMTSLMIQESVWLFVIFYIGSLIAFMLLSSQLTELILWSGEYERIELSGNSIGVGTLLIVLVFLITRMVYILKLLNIKPSIVLKTYE